MKKIVALLVSFIGLSLLPLGGHSITLAEASGILGEPCIQLEKINTAENGGHQFKTSFMAQNNDKAVLYYMFDSYKDESTANDKFDEFSQGNAALSGFENLSNLGDEAFYHTDNQNISLIIARNGNEMIRLKVNKTTPNFSKKELLNTAANVLQRI